MVNHPVLEMVLPAALVICLFLNILGKDIRVRCMGCAGWMGICAHYRIKRARLEADRLLAMRRRMLSGANNWSEQENIRYILAAPARKSETPAD